MEITIKGRAGGLGITCSELRNYKVVLIALKYENMKRGALVKK